jgi:hypothetical protein
MGDTNRVPLPQICINEKTKKPSYIPTPREWIRLMGTLLHHPNGEKIPKIPACFWQYNLVLFNKLFNGNPERVADFTMRDFFIHPNKASLYTAAYSVSGFMEVTLGVRQQNEPNTPTHFKYHDKRADEFAWSIFIYALDEALAKRAEWDKDTRQGNNVNAFKVLVARAVDEQYREYTNLKEGVNRQWLEMAASGEVRDSQGRAIAAYKNGTIEPIFYKPSPRD